MDIKKIFLYTALGIVCFSLWTAWQRDYGSQPIGQQQASAKLLNKYGQQTASKQTGGSNAQVSGLSLNADSVQVPGSRIVSVKTDVLDADIDILGGTVLSVKLPKYPSTLKNKNIPITILNNNVDKLYIAQSGITGLNNNKPLLFTTTSKTFTLNHQNKLEVNLRWKNNDGVTIVKTFTFVRGKYAVDVDYTINNISNKSISGSYYTQLKRKQPKSEGGFFNVHNYSGASISSPKTPYEKLTYTDMDKENLDRTVQGGWVAMQQRYFLAAWVPDQNIPHHYYSRVSDNDIYTLGINTNWNVASGKTTHLNNKLYIGPEIKEYLNPLANGLDHTIDYGWLWPISIAIFWVMEKIYAIVGNWGWAIIIITMLIKLLFYKLSEKSYVSMAKMKDLAPKMQAIRERYKDDKQKSGQATMELYREEGVSPLGGCLPILIQIPVFIGLYYVLLGAVQLRHAPFIFWIHDLAVHDPYYILPVLMGLSMFVTQKFNPPPPDPTQAKLMLYLMPLVFTVLFISFPSGLVLYWLMNNILSVLQQWHIMRSLKHKKSKK